MSIQENLCPKNKLISKKKTNKTQQKTQKPNQTNKKTTQQNKQTKKKAVFPELDVSVSHSSSLVIIHWPRSF